MLRGRQTKCLAGDPDSHFLKIGWDKASILVDTFIEPTIGLPVESLWTFMIGDEAATNSSATIK